MFCRQKSLKETLRNGKVWDERFFLWKDDIDLSLYLMEKGWNLKVLSNFMPTTAEDGIKKIRYVFKRHKTIYER